MLGFAGYQRSFLFDSVESMPDWVRSEKYYNCDDFVDMILHRIKKDRKNKKK